MKNEPLWPESLVDQIVAKIHHPNYTKTYQRWSIQSRARDACQGWSWRAGWPGKAAIAVVISPAGGGQAPIRIPSLARAVMDCPLQVQCLMPRHGRRSQQNTPPAWFDACGREVSFMTPTYLRSLNCKVLGQMAKEAGVPGWHAMRKEELIQALVRAGRRKSGKKQSGSRGSRTGRGRSAARSQPSASEKSRRIQRFQSTQRLMKLLSSEANGRRRGTRDRLVVMVRGPFWLQVSWELTVKSVERAAAALGEHWHTARPILRLLSVPATGATEQLLRDIDIHGGVSTWYVDVQDPPGKYRVEIGYLADNGLFHSLSRSNVVTTPAPGARDELDHNWDEVAQNCDKIYAMSGGNEPHGSAGELRELFEERLRRPMGAPLVTRYGGGADGLRSSSQLEFSVDAELIVYGACSPGSHVTFKGEPLEVREDGTFTVRVALPDKRQVIPVAATSKDGVEQRTIVIAVERNTKFMETVIREPNEVANER